MSWLSEAASGLEKFVKDIPFIGSIFEGAGASAKQDHEGEMQRRNAELQREFAQHGVRWRVEDAKRAGIHPLAALGAQTHAGQPVHVGGDTGTSAFLSSMGQNISRSIQSTRTKEEQELARLQLAGAAADVEGKTIDNQIKQTELRKLQSGPAFPGSETFLQGQGNSPTKYSVTKPLERTAGKKGTEQAAVLDTGWAETADGTVIPIPSKDVKERIEDNFIQETLHAIRNNLLPNFGSGPKPPDSALPRGYTHWEWSYSRQGYVPVKGKSKSFWPPPYWGGSK